MLKKLAKYGNSNVLVLDRAILELLNIGEGATVKLRTDGKSLIITPAEESTKPSNIHMSGMEMVTNTTKDLYEKSLEALKTDPIKNQELEQWQHDGENSQI